MTFMAHTQPRNEDDSEAAVEADSQLEPHDDANSAVNHGVLGPHSLHKRRRVTRACDECRRKKIKCDGKQPCTHCTVYSYGERPLDYAEWLFFILLREDNNRDEGDY